MVKSTRKSVTTKHLAPNFFGAMPPSVQPAGGCGNMSGVDNVINNGWGGENPPPRFCIPCTLLSCFKSLETRCEAPRSACSTKSSFFNTRMSLAAETCGALGMSERALPFWGAYHLEELEAGVSWHSFTISNQASRIYINALAHHLACYL